MEMCKTVGCPRLGFPIFSGYCRQCWERTYGAPAAQPVVEGRDAQQSRLDHQGNVRWKLTPKGQRYVEAMQRGEA